jgi:hypothetical protein
MCLTPIVDYVPRPVKPAERPVGGAPSLAEQDENLYGPKPTPPGWEEAQTESTAVGHSHTSTAPASDTAAVVAAVAGLEGGSRRIESVLIELPSGRKLLITEL